MFEALLWLFVVKSDLKNPPYISLKHLTTIMGYYPAKKLEKEKTPFRLNPEAFALAKTVDFLPSELKQIVHGYLGAEETMAKTYARSYKERNHWIFDDETQAKTEISKLPCGHPSTFTKTRIQGPLNLFFGTDDYSLNLLYMPSTAKNAYYFASHAINLDYPSYYSYNYGSSYRFGTNFKLDKTTNIVYAYTIISRYAYNIFSFPFSTKYQIKAWKPQCNLQQLQQEFSTVDWVILNTPPTYKKGDVFIL